METLLSVICGFMVAASLYLMLSGNLIRFIFGLVLATNAVNLLIFVAGRLSQTHPPLIDPDAVIPAQSLANALPQALILTAIVIGFALLTFVFILFYRAFQALDTVETELMRVSEPRQGRDAEEGGQAGVAGIHGPGGEGA
ncbi:multicomponent Na+:H+ antiporter subunit C [Desulfosalsimonas propionicica]|uniref:Multicomponent Na+:H+ antiporter subunit C n=1 Tax=Desulfosalsimonas propionicica TaxID=332175 RepID=A0A7W0HM56_9BACT|nr:Na+/H+ antiporter subunit C [Desulfosalsimonas propionicica]MBA2882947.1 multicomponent Na+:H+ antiporter subunit C [Desulfosalsimonas propionicica]